MRDLRLAYLKSWDEAEKHGGDFKDCLLHYLSKNLKMAVVYEKKPWRPTDGGVIEMGGTVSNGDDEAQRTE